MSSKLAEKYEAAKKYGMQMGSAYPALDLIEPKIPNDEDVLYVLKSFQIPKPGTNGLSYGSVMVLTDKSLHVLGKGAGGFGNQIKRTEVYNFSLITGVSRYKKLGYGWVIEISRASNIDYYGMLDDEQSEDFYNLMRDLTSKSQQSGGTTVVTQAVDPMDQLKKLKDLLDAGVISQDEFDDKKKTLMDKI